ncbi:twin-arginine translocation signal domain-containing protein [Bradyrhizobium sp. HKCCYLS20291]|uniref:twin-arginine translocation signal domain-containing protein n=1 Tax=Bradyrhizobium sp. HKCCYLS20291 TaxID=3420766 RepID=UPI003EBFFA5F
MERRDFLKLAFGLGCVAATGAVLSGTEARAAPLSPVPLNDAVPPVSDQKVERALSSQDEADRLAPEQVHWRHRGHHWGWRRRHWGWRRRHWGWRHHHRHWHRRWHRRHYW